MEDLVNRVVVPVAVGLALGYLSRYLDPRSRLVHWLHLPQPSPLSYLQAATSGNFRLLQTAATKGSYGARLFVE